MADETQTAEETAESTTDDALRAIIADAIAAGAYEWDAYAIPATSGEHVETALARIKEIYNGQG